MIQFKLKKAVNYNKMIFSFSTKKSTSFKQNGQATQLHNKQINDGRGLNEFKDLILKIRKN